MERYNSIPIEETSDGKTCRITLHEELRAALARRTLGQKISLSPMGGIVVIRAADITNIRKRSDRFIVKIDWEGNIPLPKELMDIMRWKINDKIAVYHAGEDLLILKIGALYSNTSFSSMNTFLP